MATTRETPAALAGRAPKIDRHDPWHVSNKGDARTAGKFKTLTGISITDRGGSRHVRITGFHRVAFGKPAWESAFETFYSRELLQKIADVKQQWFKDEIDRSEVPTYLEQPLRKLLQRFSIDLHDKTVLDFGCGCGASPVILAKLGGKKIVGVDSSKDAIAIARLRARDYSLANKLDFLHLRETRKLPFKDGSFAVIFCNGVIEHIPIEERGTYIAELWRLLASGGYLVFHDTPNRLWPIDSHTTGLPLVPYLPLKLARKFATRWSKRIRSDMSLEELIAAGFRGSTYWQILNPIRHQHPVVLNKTIDNDIDAFFEIHLSREPSSVKRVMIVTLRTLYKILQLVLLRPTGLPACAFLPWLTICLQKQVTKT
jgi:2-polyprenyl-3-methyl-5-hydroxy-6-metoxy-1,4-benzoquinol methylase